MQKVHKEDVIIVGAGPVGLLAAQLFLHNNCRVIILECKGREEFYKRMDISALSRLYALSLGSYEIIVNNLGIQLDTSDFQPINKILINEGNVYTIFDPKEVNASHFGFMVEENNLFKQIFNSIAEHKNLTIVYDVDIQKIDDMDDEIVIRSSDAIYKGDIILAADGRHSSIRQRLGMETELHNYDEYGLVFEIEHSFDHQGIAVETFLPTGPFAILPMKNPIHSAIVWSAPQEMIKAFLQLAAEEQHNVIQERLIQQYKGARVISGYNYYPIELIKVSELFYKNCLLIGDAAHALHPIAGQGFNLGIRDIHDMQQILLNYNTSKIIFDEKRLREYVKQRKKDTMLLNAATHNLALLFGNNNSAIKLFRKAGLGMFDNFSALKKKVIKYAMGHGFRQ